MRAEINDAFAQQWPFPFLTEAQAEEIRREARQRELVTDWYAHAEDMRNDGRDYRRGRIKDGFAAVLVSVLGVAMFIALAVCFGAR